MLDPGNQIGYQQQKVTPRTISYHNTKGYHVQFVGTAGFQYNTLGYKNNR